MTSKPIVSMPANDRPAQHATSPAALSHHHETKELGAGRRRIITTTKYWCPGCLVSFFFWVGSRRWNVNKSIRARSWGLQLPLLTIKRLFMLPWRAIPVTLAHWREPQIIISPSLCRSPPPLGLLSLLPFSLFFLSLTHKHTTVLHFCVPVPSF